MVSFSIYSSDKSPLSMIFSAVATWLPRIPIFLIFLSIFRSWIGTGID